MGKKKLSQRSERNPGAGNITPNLGGKEENGSMGRKKVITLFKIYHGIRGATSKKRNWRESVFPFSPKKKEGNSRHFQENAEVVGKKHSGRRRKELSHAIGGQQKPEKSQKFDSRPNPGSG